MSSTKKTANFKLSQFIGTDKPTFLGDYNNDMKIIDGALFTASQTAEEAVNDVENVKSAQTELKSAHEKIKEQVAQLKETADGMTGDVTAAQEAANSAEEKATAAQTAATDVVNAANTASANATKAKQTADGNKTTLDELTERVNSLEEQPKVKPLTMVLYNFSRGGGDNASNSIRINDSKYTSAQVLSAQNGNAGSFVIKGKNAESEQWVTLGTVAGSAVPSPEITLQNKKILALEWTSGALQTSTGTNATITLK